MNNLAFRHTCTIMLPHSTQIIKGEEMSANTMAIHTFFSRYYQPE